MATALDPRRLYREIVEIEKQLRDLLRANPSNVQDANVLRSRMMEKARLMAEASPTFAAAKELEQMLWKPCFYKRIEDFRRRIRKYATASSTDKSVKDHFAFVSSEFQTFLSDASAFYEHLKDELTKWLQQHRVSRIASSSLSIPASQDHATLHITKCRQSLFRALVFLGDIARYRELHSQKAKKNFAAAEGFYHKALALMPENGNPHNQLAVLATYVEAETVAVYRYCRSLMIAQPFATAEENLILLFERSRQRPLAPPSLTPLTSSSPSKDKSAFLKSFLHRLTRSHGILFSIATDQSQKTSTINYPREMESILIKDLKTLLAANAMGDALVLKIVVTNLFCVLRAINTTAAVDALRLAVSMVAVLVEFLILELEKLEMNSPLAHSMRLLGPVSTFGDCLRYNPQLLDAMEAQSASFTSTFLAQWTNLVNHPVIQDASTSLADDLANTQRLLLKENIELRGFLPLATLLDAMTMKWRDEFIASGGQQHAPTPLAEPEAFKVRAWNVVVFAKFLCEEYEGNPLLYQYNRQFATAPVGGSVEMPMPAISLGMLEDDEEEEKQTKPDHKPQQLVHEEDDEFDDEVIVFQPSPALTGRSGPDAAPRGGFLNTSSGSSGFGTFSLHAPTSPKTKKHDPSFTSLSGTGLGFPNFHTFSDFSTMPQSSGLLSGWGSTKEPTTNEPSTTTSGLYGAQIYDPMLDLDAIERESALYQRQASSLSAFMGLASTPASAPAPVSAPARSPTRSPPPGFGSGAAPPPGFASEAASSSTERRQSLPPHAPFFTRNPFLHP